MNKKFSVLMAVYSKENHNFFNDALKTIAHQTLQPNQVIIVADGPLTIELEMVINQFMHLLPLQILRLTANSGLGIALGKGMLLVKNDYVIRCDSDDVNHPLRFEKLINAAQLSDPNVAVIGSDVNEFLYEPSNVFSKRRFPVFCRKYGFFLRDPVAHPSVLLKRSHIDKVGSYLDCKFFEDTYLWLRLLRQGYIINNIQEPLVSMRLGSGLISRRRGVSYGLQELKVLRKFYLESLITLPQYIFSCMRFIVRIMPYPIVYFIYKIFLR